MRKLIYILLFISFSVNAQKIGDTITLKNGYNYTVLEKVPKYFELDKKHSFILTKNKTVNIEFEVRIKHQENTGMYLISFNNTLRKSFGFAKYKNIVSFGNRRYKDYDVKITDRKGYKFSNGELPLNEWLKVNLTSKEKVKSVQLGAWLYTNKYDIRYFKIDGLNVTQKNKTWLTDKLGDDGTLKMVNGYLLEIQLPNNKVTPRVWDYYAENNLHRGSWIDASYALQKCFDSKYDCDIPAGLYPYWKPLYLNVAKTIEFEGNSILPDDLRTQKHQTILAQMGNFHGINFQAEAKLKNGLFYSGFVDNFDKSVIRYDTNFMLEHSHLDDVTIQGKRETLYKTGKGGTAIYIDFDSAKTKFSSLSVTNMSGRIRHMAKGVEMNLNKYRTSENKFWAATINTDFYMRGVKQPLLINGGNVDYHKLYIQDQAVLNAEERYLKAVTINTEKSFADIFMVDGGKYDKRLKTWSHEKDYIAPVPPTLKFINRSFIYNTSETKKQLLKTPKQLTEKLNELEEKLKQLEGKLKQKNP